MWLTGASCAKQIFNQSVGLVAYLIIVYALWFCSTAALTKDWETWATGPAVWQAAFEFVTPITRWTLTPPTCILTAIDREFSSLSSSLRTTSFFSVRLQSLWTETIEGKEKNILVTWPTQCEQHTFMTHCSSWEWKALAALDAAYFFFFVTRVLDLHRRQQSRGGPVIMQ